jgi:hypothetical protein
MPTEHTRGRNQVVEATVCYHVSYEVYAFATVQVVACVQKGCSALLPFFENWAQVEQVHGTSSSKGFI